MSLGHEKSFVLELEVWCSRNVWIVPRTESRELRSSGSFKRCEQGHIKKESKKYQPILS